MNSQTFFSLSNRFPELKGKTPCFSLRAFARDLNQNPAVISQIFRAKRKPSKGFALEGSNAVGNNGDFIAVLKEGGYEEYLRED